MPGRSEKEQRAERDLLFEVNAHVHEAARRFEGPQPEPDVWDFTCECGVPDCRVPVPLTLAEYEALRAANRPVLASGHEKVAPADELSTA
ncbi:MAG: hypothetical protein E6G12_05500 [Actinobacteria bacterium]|nr:MAG: hypothetical protein E6G12_05500 [Actinomycetota bacterium]